MASGEFEKQLKEESQKLDGTMEGVRVLTGIYDGEPKEKVEEEMKEFTEFRTNNPSHIDEGFYKSVKSRYEEYLNSQNKKYREK